MRQWAYYFLFLFVFFIPAESSVVFTGFGTVSKLFGVIAFGVGGAAVVFTGVQGRATTFHALVLAFIGWAFLTYWWSLDPQRTLKEIVTLVQVGLMVLLLTEFARSEDRQMGLMQAYVLGAGLTVGFTMYRLITGQVGEGPSQRFAVFGADPNRTALILTLAIPMAWYLAGQTRLSLLAWINRLYVPAAGLAVLVTGSRSGFLALVVSLLFLVFSIRGLSVGKKAAVLAMLVAGSVAALQLVPEATLDRLNRGRDEIRMALEGDADAGSHRIGVWLGGLEAFYDRPLLGAGLGAFPEALKPHYETVDHVFEDSKPAHNTYLSVLVEMGVVGFGLFAALLGLLVYTTGAMPPRERLLFLMLLGVWATSTMFITQIDKKHTWFLFTLVAVHGQMARTYQRHWLGQMRASAPALSSA